MANQNTFTALDIGSSKIRCLVGVMNEAGNTVNVIGVGLASSNGIRRGIVTDVDEAVANITQALDEAERMSGEPIHRATISVSGTHIETYNSKGVIAISGQNAEITEDDVDRVLEAARTVSLPSNRSILRIIPKSFSVDSQSGIKYPVGMSGIRLEVEAHIIAGQTAAIKNLEKCLYQTGIDADDIVPSTLSCAEAILTKKQRELGCVLIEIGASSTNVAIFEEGTVVYSTIIPIGGEHVTNDIAIGTRISIDTAEKLKIEFGNALTTGINDREEIDLYQMSAGDGDSLKKKFLAEMIHARYQEIFMLVKEAILNTRPAGSLPAGAVLCGGAVKIPGALELSREILELPVQMGFPRSIEGVVDRIDDPSFASSVGLLKFAHKYGSKGSVFNMNFGNFLESITKFFKSLIP